MTEKKLTLAEKLQEWNRCKSESSRLHREAKSYDATCDLLEKDFEEELKKSGKDSITRSGFKLFWGKGRASVSWAAEFLSIAGPERVAKLKEEAASNTKKSFCIEAPTQ